MPKGAYGYYGGYQGSVIVTGQGAATGGGGAIITGPATTVHGSQVDTGAASSGTVIINNQGATSQGGTVIIENPTPTPCEGQGIAVPCESTMPITPPTIIETPVAPTAIEGQNCPPTAPATPQH